MVVDNDERTITNPNPDEIDPLTLSLEGVQEEKVGFRLGKTINLGNYESARVDIWNEKRYPVGATAQETEQNREEALTDIKVFCNKTLKTFVNIIEKKRETK